MDNAKSTARQSHRRNRILDLFIATAVRLHFHLQERAGVSPVPEATCARNPQRLSGFVHGEKLKIQKLGLYGVAQDS